MVSIIAISNNLVRDFELDDRVRSRIGTCEVFFEPYKKYQVLDILRNVSEKAFSVPIDDEVLQKCADVSSAEHGDARRAIELLKISSEIASFESVKIIPEHVVKADSKLQKNTFYEYHRHASHHSRQVMNAIARLSYLTDKPCHSTSRIYKQYSNMEEKGLSYRRISDILSELTQGGILHSNTRSSGRHGYGTQYELRIPPDMILKIYKELFEKLQEDKKRHLKVKESPEWRIGYTSFKTWDKYYEKVSWREYVDFEEQNLGS